MAGTAPPRGGTAATRRFVVVCHRALPACACKFRLTDLKEKRLDLVARCISSSLFLSEGTRRDTEVVFCFPLADHDHLGSMRQRLQHKKQQPEEETVDQSNIEPSSSQETASADLLRSHTKRETNAQPGWFAVRVSGNDIRHLKPDERTVGSILRHFLYDGECIENKSSDTHAVLLASEGYQTLDINELCSSLSKDWLSLPVKKCCKGFSFKRISSLAEVIPCCEWRETVGHSVLGSTSDTKVLPNKQPKLKRQFMHMMYFLHPSVHTKTPNSILHTLRLDFDQCNSETVDEMLGTTVIRSFVMGDDVGFIQSDEDELRPLGGVPTSLGPGMILSSHCVVLLNHYLDFLDAAPEIMVT